MSVQIDSQTQAQRDEAAPEFVVAQDRPGAADRVQELVTSGKPLTWNELATVAAGFDDFRVRDAVLRHLLETPRFRMNARVTLMDAVRRCSPERVAPFATVLAGTVWLDGNGPLARVAIDRALESDADYMLARLLDRAVSAGLSPRVWAESLAALTREQCLAGAA